MNDEAQQPDVEQELQELGQIISWHEALKKQNDKAEKKQQYVMANRADKRRQKKLGKRRG